MQIVERIKDTAAKQGYTLSDLEHNLGFGSRTIYKWNTNAPSVEKVLAVANFLRVSLNWLVTGKHHDSEIPEPFFQKYNALPLKDKERINHYIEICQCYHFDHYNIYPATDQKDLPIIASAKHSDTSGNTEILGHINADADFIFVMNDSSMFPLYSPNQHLYVKQADTLTHGDIGIIICDHHILCRQYIESGQEIILRSINTDFSELVFSKNDKMTLKPIGKVLSE